MAGPRGKGRSPAGLVLYFVLCLPRFRTPRAPPSRFIFSGSKAHIAHPSFPVRRLSPELLIPPVRGRAEAELR